MVGSGTVDIRRFEVLLPSPISLISTYVELALTVVDTAEGRIDQTRRNNTAGEWRAKA
jgi:hypothetical protein